jgi:hypothetical protein
VPGAEEYLTTATSMYREMDMRFCQDRLCRRRVLDTDLVMPSPDW